MDGAEISLAIDGAFQPCQIVTPATGGAAAQRTVVCGANGVSQYLLVKLPTQLQSAAAGSVGVSVCVQPGETGSGVAVLGWQGMSR